LSWLRLVIIGVGIGLLMGLLLGSVRSAKARDADGRYAQSENHEWFKALHSPAGSWCCDISDGHAITEAEWRSRDGHYQVLIDAAWIDVPDDAVITEPNKDGRTVVWFRHQDGVPVVTCFMPGGGF
jgi:hypothetical protein